MSLTLYLKSTPEIMYKQFLKSACIILAIAFLVNSCEDDFFGNKTLEGQWGAVEISSISPPEGENFIVYIIHPDEDMTKAEIENFSGLGDEIIVYLEINDRAINIPLREYTDRFNNSFFISGNGTISNNFRKINLNYSYDNISFTAELIKQF
jgi:hypothetical protein